MESSKQQFWLGLALSCTTALFWGMIPIALKLSSGFADPVTLTWSRFTFAAIVVFVWQWQHGRLHEFRQLNRKEWLRLFAAGCFLIINYTTFAWGVTFLRPEVAQLGMQISPVFMALGGLLFLKEQVSWQQWACFGLLILGLLVFFHPVLTGDYHGDVHNLVTGLIIIFISAFSWCIYALTQKTLFKKLSSSNILLMIYILATVVMAPFSSPMLLTTMSSNDTWVMLFCCINTVVAYGAFTQAMRYWETVQVSAVIAVVPVVVFVLTELCVVFGLWSSIISESHVDWLSMAGMFMVVGSAISVQVVSARANRKRRQKLEQQHSAQLHAA
ncbi:DMT family transporter [Vibrio nitrifigilis]|uniref:DMT family transporter n=1 Tax=Vibrio nitrifigilis TaxID=2789781 RepID=A0ABS0GCJ9_9VIBR|nr:DMT family transporter [Vibrio nitrifigilis]MBF9000102.1 DMT family transporter [Vibrio nitrifigilis]